MDVYRVDWKNCGAYVILDELLSNTLIGSNYLPQLATSSPLKSQVHLIHDFYYFSPAHVNLYIPF